MEQQVRWSSKHRAKVIRSFNKDILPALGTTPVKKVTPQDILAVIRSVEERGSYDVAARVLQRIGAVCRYAVQTGRATYNPASEMQGVLKTRQVKHMDALDKEYLPEFLVRLSAANIHPVSKAGLKFTILTSARPTEVRLALWPEISFSTRLWSVPAERMKSGLPHTVYLSDQAIKVLEDMKRFSTGEEGLIFPGIKDPYNPLSNGTFMEILKKILKEMEYKKTALILFKTPIFLGKVEKNGGLWNVEWYTRQDSNLRPLDS